MDEEAGTGKSGENPVEHLALSYVQSLHQVSPKVANPAHFCIAFCRACQYPVFTTMKKPILSFLSTAAFLWLSAMSGLAQETSEEPTIDINRQLTAASATASSMVKVNVDGSEILILAMNDPLSGTEIWRSDGTVAGTTQIRDLLPGPAGSEPKDLTTVGNRVFFTALEANGGCGLWVTDGKFANTLKLATFSASPSEGQRRADRLFAFNGRLIFRGYSVAEGSELWTSDGTVAGTVLNKDIYESSLNSDVDHFYVTNNTLYFTANDGVHGREMWKMNSSFVASLYQDIQIGTESAFPADSTPIDENTAGFQAEFTAIGGNIYFIADGKDYATDENEKGIELWRTDGTGTKAGTKVVLDIVNGSESSVPRSLKAMNVGTAPGVDYLFFAPNQITGSGRELWRSNSVTLVTELVKDIATSPTTSAGSSANNLIVLDKTLFFTANNGRGVELFRSNGLPGIPGTNPATSGTASTAPTNFNIFTDKLIFTGTNASGRGLYFCKTTGAEVLIKQFDAPGDKASHFTPIGSNLYFLVNGSQLWVTNGVNTAGTTQVKNFQVGNGSSFPTGMSNTGAGVVYFSATNGINGAEPWKTNGTLAGTVMVKDIRTDAGLGSLPDSFTTTSTRTYFTADATGSNRELWMTDGTEAGTVVVKTAGDAEINTTAGSNPLHLTAVDNLLYFSAISATGRDPWVTDGTPAGTHIIADLSTISGQPDPDQFTKFRNDVFFVSGSGSEGRRLRKISDPTSHVDIESLSNEGPLKVTEMTLFGTSANQRMYFVAEILGKGVELWKSDGTNAGTEIIDINPGPVNSSPAQLTVVGNALYFVATDGNVSNTGRELWRSTGSLATTKLVKDIVVGAGSPDIENMVEAGGKLFFTAQTEANGRELWVSNGTAAGTFMLKDIIPGTGSPGIQEMKNIDGILCFSADDGINGREVWISDGTSAGTTMLDNLGPFSAGSNPAGFTSFNGRVLYSASTVDNGNELHLSFIGPDLSLRLKPDNNQVASASTVNFPNVDFKQNTTLTFSITNIGRNTLKDVKPLMSGINASEFTLVAPKPTASVLPGQSTSMAVRFTPKEGGIRRATLTLLSNDNEPKPYLVYLEGIGNKDPEILTQPGSLMRKVGEAASFTSTSSTGLNGLQWKKGTSTLAGATGTTLTLNSVTLKDAGAYSLFVKGASLTALSNPAELGVVEDYSVPLVIAAELGKIATLKVNTAGNQLTYQWQMKRVGETDPTPVENDARISGAATKTLVIKGLLDTDTAEYSCVVTNPGNSKVGGTTQLNVFGIKPDVLDVQSMPNGIVGGEYYHKIKVDTASNKAPLTYSAKGLPAGLKVNAKTGEITGRPTKEGTYAQITVTATNTKGADTSIIQVPAIDIALFPTGVEGIYAGTLDHSAEINGSLGGRLDLTITKTGAYSGSLMLGATRLALKGAVNVFRAETNTLPYAELVLKRSGKPAPQDVKLRFEIDPATGLLTNTSRVTTADNVHSALITGWRRVNALAAANYVGYYTFGLRLGDPGLVGGTSVNKVPQGWSYGSFTVAKDGKLTLSGRTADGDKITGASFVGVNGKIVVFQTMYTPLKGSLVGDLLIEAANVADATDNTLTGDVKWARPADVKSKTRTYIAGFGMPDTPEANPVSLEASGAVYVKPAGTALVLDLPAPTTLDLDFRHGGLLEADAMARIDASVILTAGNKITQPSPATTAQTKLASIAAATGAFTGTFALSDPDPLGGSKPISRKVTFQGMMIKDGADKVGVGFFLLPELPETGETPTTTPILGGEIELTPVAAP